MDGVFSPYIMYIYILLFHESRFSSCSCSILRQPKKPFRSAIGVEV